MNKLFDLITFDLTPTQRKLAISLAWRAGVVVHIVIACGWAAWAGVSGFALTTDVDHIRNSQASTSIELLESRLFEARLRNCTATSIEAKQFYSARTQELLSKFIEITGRSYQLPDCSSVRL